MKQQEIDKLAEAIGNAVTPKWFEISNRLNIVGENVSYAAKAMTEAAARFKPEPSAPKVAPPKFCTNCRHARPTGLIFKSYKYAKCARPNSTEGGRLVTGDDGFYCSTERDGLSDHMCGKRGQWFEPR